MAGDSAGERLSEGSPQFHTGAYVESNDNGAIIIGSGSDGGEPSSTVMVKLSHEGRRGRLRVTIKIDW